LVTLVFTGLLAGIQEVSKINAKWLVLPQLAPGIAFFLMCLVFKNERIAIVARVQKRISHHCFLSLMTPLTVMGIVFVLARYFLEIPVVFEFNTSLLAFLPGILIGAVGEEIGWRSYLQPLLEKRFSALISAVIVGLIWGLWHIGHYGNGIVFMIGFLLFTCSASFVITLLLKDTAYNLILTSAFHFAINLGFYLFFYARPTDVQLMLMNGFCWLIVAVIWALIRRFHAIRSLHSD
jgi:membrane protease YdiL (CAAX protease family)